MRRQIAPHARSAEGSGLFGRDRPSEDVRGKMASQARPKHETGGETVSTEVYSREGRVPRAQSPRKSGWNVETRTITRTLSLLNNQ